MPSLDLGTWLARGLLRLKREEEDVKVDVDAKVDVERRRCEEEAV